MRSHPEGCFGQCTGVGDGVPNRTQVVHTLLEATQSPESAAESASGRRVSQSAAMDLIRATLSVAAALTSAVTAVLPSSPSHGPPGQGPAVWPITPASVVRPYETTTRYGPGHRGVDLAAEPGDPVLAALPGRVAVAGPVAGRPVVVLLHRGPLRTTYLPVDPQVEVGDRVSRGQVIGVVGGAPHCPGGCVHWGARDDDGYLDPLSLLRSRPVVLLPDP